MRIGFFGTGNMGSAIARGIRQHSSVHDLYLYNPTTEKAVDLAKTISGKVIEKLPDMPLDLDWYFLAFKPQSLGTFQFNFPKDAKIISVLAGTNVKSLVDKFHTNKIVRLMPNTPSSIGKGVNLLFGNFDFSDLLPLINSTGKSFVLSEENLIDQLTPYSGSGPALIFEFASQFEKNIFKITKNDFLSREIVSQLFLGSSELILNGYSQNKSLLQLKNEVTSNVEVTFESLKVLL